eukprot:3628188-Prymnesium_polylepis.1
MCPRYRATGGGGVGVENAMPRGRLRGCARGRARGDADRRDGVGVASAATMSLSHFLAATVSCRTASAATSTATAINSLLPCRALDDQLMCS